MQMSSSQPPTVQTKRSESLTGLLRRAARAEGFVDLADYVSMTGCRYGRPLIEDLEGAAHTLRIPVEVLEDIAPAEIPGTPPARQWHFHRHERDPFCPHCLRDEGTWRPEWRVCWVTSCEVHGRRLRDECDQCGEPLTPNSGGLDVCGCGRALAAMSTVPATAGEMDIARLVTGTSSAFGVEPTIDLEANRLIRLLAGPAQPGRTGKAGKTPLPRSVAEAVEMTPTAGDILTQWPKAFDDEVRRRWREGPSDGRTAAQRLGPWYRQLAVLQGPYAQALKKRLKEVTAAELGDLYARPADTGAADKHWLSVAEGAEWLGVSQDRLRSAIRAGYLNAKAHRAGFGHAHTIVRRSDLQEIRTMRATYIDAKAARSWLGVSKTQLALLVEAQAVVPQADADDLFLVDGRVHRPTLEAKVSAIAAHAPSEEGDAVETVAFHNLNLRRTTDRRRLLELLRAIFEGEIAPVKVGNGSTLGNFEFAAADVQTFLDGSSSPILTAAEVARMTGWKAECVTHWCRGGVLRAYQKRTKGIDQWQISASDLADFQSTYAVLADVARARGTTSRVSLGWCARKGIEVVGQKVTEATSRGGVVRVSDLFEL